MGLTGLKLWSWVVVFTLAGLALLWWTEEQLHAARLVFGSTFEFPVWRFLGVLVTQITLGAMFGLAAAAAREGVSRAELRVAAVAGIVPLAAIVGFWTEWIFDWAPPGGLTILLRSQTTASTSSITVGFLGAGLVAHLTNRSKAAADGHGPVTATAP